MATKSPRSDAGQVRITQRDVEIVTFMGEQYGLRKDQLPRLVPGVSERTIRALIDRWVRAGLVNRRTIFAGDHAWLWPTRDGLETPLLRGGRSPKGPRFSAPRDASPTSLRMGG